MPETLRRPSWRPATCRVAGCGRLLFARELCSGHYARLRRHGNVLSEIPVARGQALWRRTTTCRWCSDGLGGLCDGCIDAFRDDLEAITARLFPLAMLIVSYGGQAVQRALNSARAAQVG